MAQPILVKDIDDRVKDTGDIMTGELDIMTPIDQIPNFKLIPSNGANGQTLLYKNTSSVKDYGTHLVDSDIDGNGLRITLIANRKTDFANSAYLRFYNAETASYTDYPLYHTGYKPTAAAIGALPISGGTMTGALNLANGVWNLCGDDCYFGDNNAAGAFCIKGNNGNTQLRFVQYGGSNYGSITYDGSILYSNVNFRVQKTNPALELYDTTTTRLARASIDSSGNLCILNWKGTDEFTQIAVVKETLGTNDIIHCYRKTASTALEDYVMLHAGNYTKYCACGTGMVGSDFNTQTISGMYRFDTASSHANIPPLSWGQVLVVHGAGDTIAQVAFDYSGLNIYARVGNPPECGGAGAWKTWGRIWCEGNSVTSAVWNDYAECREADTIEPGYVLVEVGDDTLTKSTERMQPFAGISSDTWGFSQGETAKAKTPIAVAGRVLVYPFQERENYKPGDCVCAAPNGTVDIMTEEEIYKHPDRIVGTVSCVPTYEEWGGGENADRGPVKVNGRIWIKVR